MYLDADEVLSGNEGNTTTAFGTHEWLIKAVTGEIETPMLDRSVGHVSANELDTNCETPAGRSRGFSLRRLGAVRAGCG